MILFPVPTGQDAELSIRLSSGPSSPASSPARTTGRYDAGATGQHGSGVAGRYGAEATGQCGKGAVSRWGECPMCERRMWLTELAEHATGCQVGYFPPYCSSSSCSNSYRYLCKEKRSLYLPVMKNLIYCTVPTVRYGSVRCR